jgi:hypothetical protein
MDEIKIKVRKSYTYHKTDEDRKEAHNLSAKEHIRHKKAAMTDEQRAELRLKDKLYKQKKRAEMTDEQRAEMNRIRREKQAAKKASV